MTTKAPLLTIADWDALPAEDGNRYEIIDEKNPIGEFLPTVGLVLSQYSGVIPDVVVFLHETSGTIISGDRLTGPPDLVIEVISPGPANVRDRVEKLQLYAKHRVPEYWIVDPGNLAVEQYVSHGSSLRLAQTLQREDVLSSSAIPGFSCLTSDIFTRIGK